MAIKKEDRSHYSNIPDSRASKGKFYYGWVILIICLILITISYGIRFSFGVFFKSLEQDFSLTRAMTSGIFSVYMLLGALFAIIGGWVTDRYGPRVVLLVTGVFAFLGLALTSQVNSTWQLFLSYSLLVAIGTAPIYVVATSEAIRWFMPRRGLALAIVTCGVGLGSILIAPVAAQFIDSFGWRLASVFIGLIALIAIILPSIFLRRAPKEIIVPSEDKNKRNFEANTLDKIQKESKDLSPRQAVKTRNFWLLIGMWIFYAFCLFTISTHIVPHAIDLGISPVEAAAILSVIGFASIPGRILMGPLSDRIGRKPTGMASALLMMAAMIWLMQSTSLWTLYIFGVIFGIAFGGLSPTVTATVSDSFGTRYVASIMGILEIGWVIGAAAGPALAGYIFDTTGEYFLAFILMAVAAFILAILILFIKVPKTKSG